MTWLAVADCNAASGGGAAGDRSAGTYRAPQKAGAGGELLARGSLVVEIDFSIDGHTPAMLLHYTASQGWERRFTIYLNADFSLSVEAQQGRARSYVRLTGTPTAPTGRARLTYSWDAPRQIGLFSLEDLESGAIHQAVFQAPIPLPLLDGTAIVRSQSAAQFDNRICGLALSDRIEAVGPAPTIAAGALVETPAGPRPIESLRLGDMIDTAAHGPQPIRWIIKSELPALGHLAPICLRAPYLGLTGDILVAHDQHVVISGVEAEYNFGEDSVLIKAGQLTGLPAATVQGGQQTQKYYQILLDNHECIRLSGAWCESLFVGRLAHSPAVLATTRLAEMSASAVPVHHGFARPVLRHYESQTLLAAMSA